MLIIGIGNTLQKDDGFGVYAAAYLRRNYRFAPPVSIIEGGVEGIGLYRYFEENDTILLLDTIDTNDRPGSIYLFPADALEETGLNIGGAHEIGALQCFQMLRLAEKPIPNVYVAGVVPQLVTFEIGLSKKLLEVFMNYIDTVLYFLQQHDIKVAPATKQAMIAPEEIITSFR